MDHLVYFKEIEQTDLFEVILIYIMQYYVKQNYLNGLYRDYPRIMLYLIYNNIFIGQFNTLNITKNDNDFVILLDAVYCNEGRYQTRLDN